MKFFTTSIKLTILASLLSGNSLASERRELRFEAPNMSDWLGYISKRADKIGLVFRVRENDISSARSRADRNVSQCFPIPRRGNFSIGRTFLNIIALEVGSKEVPMNAFDDLNQILRRNFVRAEGIACLIYPRDTILAAVFIAADERFSLELTLQE